MLGLIVDFEGKSHFGVFDSLGIIRTYHNITSRKTPERQIIDLLLDDGDGITSMELVKINDVDENTGMVDIDPILTAKVRTDFDPSKMNEDYPTYVRTCMAVYGELTNLAQESGIVLY